MAENKAVIKVKASADIKAIAHTIVSMLDEHEQVELRSIGAGATNQSVKAICLARVRATTKVKDLVTRQGFSDTTINGEQKTVIIQVVSYK